MFTTLTIPIVNKIGKRFNLFDWPEIRKQNKNLMVRLGGISLFLGFIVSLGLFDFFSESSLILENKNILLIIMSFFFLGLVDDLKRISPLKRLFIEILLASFAWANNFGIYTFDFSLSTTSNYYLELPTMFSYLVTVLWLVGITNAINWMDGLDGLASGIVLISSLGMIIICLKFGNFNEIPFLVSLCGICLGFLKYNFYPSKIFMGDSGSYLLGFCIGLFSITGSTRTINQSFATSSTSVLIPAIILLIPLLDMTSVICTRVIKQKSPFYPDRSHLHYRLVDKGLSDKNTVITIYIFSLINILIASLLI